MENSVVIERGWSPSGDEPKEWNSTRKVKEEKKKNTWMTVKASCWEVRH